MCAGLSGEVAKLQAVVRGHKENVIASAQKVHGLEVTVEALNKSVEKRDAHLRGTSCCQCL